MELTAKTCNMDKGHNKNNKRLQQEDVAAVNVHVLNDVAQLYIK